MARVTTQLPDRRQGMGRRGLLAAAAVVLVLGALAAYGLESRWTSGTLAGQEAPSASASGATPTYAADVAPILARSCVSCHGPQRADKGLRLDSYQRTLAGDSYGTVLIPGDSSLSALVSVLKYGTMPHGGVRLSASEIEVVSKWIDGGAPEK